MKIMIIAQDSPLLDPPGNPALRTRIEKLLTDSFRGSVQVAAAYVAGGEEEGAFVRDGITYYPLKCRLDMDTPPEAWEESRQKLTRAIGDFSPDVIHCMGAEWPYGLIAASVPVPVVIHLMGFLNTYFPALDMVLWYSARALPAPAAQKPAGFLKRMKARLRRSLKALLRQRTSAPEKSAERISDILCRRERKIMASVHYFMGRTEWDRNLVKYYAPGSKYYHVEELMKPCILEAAGQWKYSRRAGEPLRLLTVSSGDDRKGNEIILRTASLLKELLGIAFEWRVSGSRDFIDRYERITGIRHADVNVKLIGYISAQKVIEELKGADLFIHPSIIDNSSNAICEAQVIGCPVIASYVGGNMDLVEDRVTGFLYPYNEPHTLAFLIGNICQDEHLLNAVSVNAVKAACERHDPERIAQALYRTYEDMISEHEKRTREKHPAPGGCENAEDVNAP